MAATLLITLAVLGMVRSCPGQVAGAGAETARRQRLDALEAWSRGQVLDGWPMSNLGDPDLKGVVFLYDLAITAQAHLAAGRARMAVDLLRRVRRDWPRALGGFVDSLDVVRRQPFDRFNGTPRVTNGPNMHLALAALTTWASGSGRDDGLLDLAREIAELILRQTRDVGAGAIPYGPEGQRFPDGTPFRKVFNPEYQIDAYALFHRMGLATGEPAWETAAGRSLDWLTANQYDRGSGRFWARNDRKVPDSPLDVPGWAMSMVGPNELAARGVNVPALIADLGRLPAGVVPTEWLVNRRNGLKLGLDYLAARGHPEADQARRRLAAMDKVLLGLPLQPAAKGGGLAYAYRMDRGGRRWEPAEGVPTGWGWNTQRGSSRVAADYLLASLAHNHDPVDGRLNGRPLQWRPLREEPARPEKPPRAAALGATQGASGAAADGGASYRHRIALRDHGRSLTRVIISRMLLDPTPGANAPADAPPVITIQPHGGRRVLLRSWNAFEDHLVLWGLGAGPGGAGLSRIAAIGLRRRLEEQRFLVEPGVTVSASNGHQPRSPAQEQIRYRYILIEPAKDFEITARFFHLSADERERALRSALDISLRAEYERAPSYEEWARSHPGASPAPRKFGRAEGFFRVVGPDGAILAPTARLVTIDADSGELTGFFQTTAREFPWLIGYKRPLTPEEFERALADRRPGSMTGRLRLVSEPAGEYFEWTTRLDNQREQAIDSRVFRREGKELVPGDRVIQAPSQQGLMSEAVRLNTYLSASGYLDGMVIGGRPRDRGSSPFVPSTRQPGWIFLRPRLIGRRTRDWEYLKRVELARRMATDDPTRRRLDRAYEEGERVLNWLADLEAHLRSRLGEGVRPHGEAARWLEAIRQARSNIWEDGDDCLLVVGRPACEEAVRRLAQLDQILGPRPEAAPDLADARSRLKAAIERARALNLDREVPVLSRYEELLREYRAHLDRLRAEVRRITRELIEGADESRQAALREARSRLQENARTMSFRGQDGQYYSLTPGQREVEALLALIEEAEGVPAGDRVARRRSAPAQPAEAGGPLALLDPGMLPAPRSLEQRHLRYRDLYRDSLGHTLVEVASDRGWLHRYEVQDALGGLVGRFQGRIRINGQPAAAGATLSSEDRVQADFFSHVRYLESGGPVGEHLVPLSQSRPTSASELVASALRAAWAGARPNVSSGEKPLYSTERLDPRGTTVKVQTRHDGATYFDHFRPSTTTDLEVRPERRVYDAASGAWETYQDHRLNPVTAAWVPGQIEVWYLNQRTEVREFLRFDQEGRASHRVRTLGLVPSRLLRALPLPLRPLLPGFLRAQPGVTIERVDTREPDGLLYCRDLRGPGAIHERTYYDVDRERDIFAATGQNIEVPLETYHAAADYTVDPSRPGRPFVFFAVVHNPLSEGVVDHLATYEVNVESTYAANPEGMEAGAVILAAVSGPPLLGLAAATAAPQPREVVDLILRQGLREPPGRRFRWTRRLHLLSQAGQRNQRGETVSELSEIEVETEDSLVQHVHEKRDGPGWVQGRENARRYIPKTPDGRFYIKPRGQVVLSDPSTREVPSGCFQRRLPDPNATETDLGPLSAVVWIYEGRADPSLDAEGLLPVILRGSRAAVARVAREDAFERATAVMEFPVPGPLGRLTPARVVQTVDPDAWFWHPRHRRWYPRAMARYTDGILDERRTLVEVDGVPRIDPVDGRATYRVQPFHRGDPRAVEPESVGPLAKVANAQGEVRAALTPVARLAWRLSEIRRIIRAVAQIKPVEPYEVVVDPGGSIVERRDQFTTVMNLPLARDLLARSGYECVIPAAVFERGQGGEAGEMIARFTAELRTEGRFLTLARTSTHSADWSERIYERDPVGVRDPFGRWAHWRLVSESGGSRPGVAAYRTLVFYKGDEQWPRRGGLLPEVQRQIDGFLARQQRVRRGRGYTPPDAGETGRIVFDGGSSLARPLLYQFVLGVSPGGRPGASAPFVCATLHDWPGAEPLVRLTDHLGRPAGDVLPGPGQATREVEEADVEFDRDRFTWVVRRSHLVETKPPGYVSEDLARPHPPGRRLRSQEDVSLGWAPANQFYPDAPELSRLEQIRYRPTPEVGDPSSQGGTMYHDELGRLWLETHATHNLGTDIEWITYYPQAASLEFRAPGAGGVLTVRARGRGAEAFESADFLLFYVRGPAADSARVWCRSGDGPVHELPRSDAWGRGCWNADFDDPIVLEQKRTARTVPPFRVIAVRPMRGKAPLWPVEDSPRAVIVPVAWLRQHGIDPARLSLGLAVSQDLSTVATAVEATPVERLVSPGSATTWLPSARGQSTLFPVNPPDERIAERTPKVMALANDIVVVFRGRGPSSRALVYDQGRLVAATFHHRDGQSYERIRMRLADAASPFLRVPLYYEAVSNGWLGRLVRPVEYAEGRTLLMVSNVNQPLVATLFPYGGGRAGRMGIVRSGSNPVIAYPPLGMYDPESRFPRFGASLLNALARQCGSVCRAPASLLGTVPARPARELLDPHHVRSLVEESPLDLPSGWPWRPIPAAPAPAVAVPSSSVRLPDIQSWADEIEAMIEGRAAVPLPETNPGTPRSGFAETHEVAEILVGLVRAARSTPDPAVRDRRLAVAARIMGFYRLATSDGARPVLSSYRTHTGARHAFSDEWRLPGLSLPTARANVALTRAALSLAAATGSTEICAFAARLATRVLEFVPDADPLWPRHRDNPQAVRDHATTLAKQLVIAWGAGPGSRRLKRGRILARARKALERQAIEPPCRELIRRFVAAPAPAEHSPSGAGEQLAQDMISEAFQEGHRSLARAVASGVDLSVAQGAIDGIRENVFRLIELVLGETEEDLARLRHWYRACGGLCEHPPRTAVRLPDAGLTLSPETDRYELPTNAAALDLLALLADALTTGSGRAPAGDPLRADVVAAHARLRDWFRFIVLPVVARSKGHAPNHWRQQRWITGVLPTALEAREEPHVIVPNRWTTLEASLAAARAALAVEPAAADRVRDWLTNLLKVYGSVATSHGRAVSGMSFTPDTFARYEGPLYSSVLTLEFAAMARRVGHEPGRSFAEGSLATFLETEEGHGHALVRAAFCPEPVPPGEAVETGDGRTLYTRAGGRGEFGWSPVATLLAAEAAAGSGPASDDVDLSGRPAMARALSLAIPEAGASAPSHLSRETAWNAAASLTALLAMALAILALARRDVERGRRAILRGRVLPDAAASWATMRNDARFSRLPEPVLPRKGQE